MVSCKNIQMTINQFYFVAVLNLLIIKRIQKSNRSIHVTFQLRPSTNITLPRVDRRVETPGT